MIVPKTDVAARRIRRKIVSLREEKISHTIALNPFESLLAKMILVVRKPDPTV